MYKTVKIMNFFTHAIPIMLAKVRKKLGKYN